MDKWHCIRLLSFYSEKMYRFLALFMFFLLGFSLAANIIRVPNSKISYYYSNDPIDDTNDSSIFIDGVATQSYVEFVCDKGLMRFFLTTQNDLLTQDDYNRNRQPKITFRADQQEVQEVGTLTVIANKDVATGHHLRSLAVPDGKDALLFSAFQRATDRVAIRIKRSDGLELTYSFKVRGFSLAYQGIRKCQ